MRKASFDSFFERACDAFLFATASNAEILELSRQLGDDPDKDAEHVRELLLRATSTTQSRVPMPDSARSTLSLTNATPRRVHRILLVDDDPARLAARFEEFRLHQLRLGIVIETACNASEALGRLQTEQFEAVLIDLRSATEETQWVREKLRDWSTPLAPILLNSEGMEVLELRRLNREAVRAIAKGLGERAPSAYRKAPKRVEIRKPSQGALFGESEGKKTGGNGKHVCRNGHCGASRHGEPTMDANSSCVDRS
jgi:CheY-like chemotaxis protein